MKKINDKYKSIWILDIPCWILVIKFLNISTHLKLNRNKIILFLLILIIQSCFLIAEQIDFSIDYLGLKVIDVTMTIADSSISVTAKSTPLGSIAAKMDNFYFSKFDEKLLPYFYKKKIKQKDYFEDRIIHYDRAQETAIRTGFLNDDISCEYPINKNSRDFFSALLFIRKNMINQNGTIWIDANKLIWKASFEIIKQENLSTKLGKVNTDKVIISFQKISKEEKERSDMLTNNLVNEENKLYFWFTADERRLPIKAVYSMRPFPVVWNLEKYQN